MRAVRLGVVMATAAAVVLLSAAPGYADREFEVAFSKNDAGNILLATNSVLSCQEALPGCENARNAARGAQLGNNSWAMRYLDVDSDPGTFNSSSAQLTLPAGATVLFARLYWGANLERSARGEPAIDPGARGTVLFDTPAPGGYAPVDAARVDTGRARSQAGAYQAYADVLDQVRASGAGSYSVANVQAGTGDDRYGGWALVVAYASSAEPARNMTVFDGFESVNSGDAPREISVRGFTTPPSGPVRSRLGFVAYEGDLSLGGDSASLNGSDLSDATNPANNFFNSAISVQGQNVTSRTPAFPNNLGYDSDVIQTERLPNGATSAAIRLKTTGDTYIPGVVFVATELFAPDLRATKAVSDLNGGLVEPGDELEYTISGTNQGQDAAVSTILSDAVPAGTDFVPGSLVTGGAARTDGADGDTAELQGGSGQVVFRVGSGASGTAGGTVAPGASYEARYRVRVSAGTPAGTPIVNQARVSSLADTLGFPLDSSTNETRLTVSAPDLSINKRFVQAGSQITYSMTVSNVGDAPTRGEVVVTDPLPGAISFGPPAGDGWACTQTPALEVSCTRSDSLAPGAAWPDITIVGTGLGVPPLVNTSTVAGGGDTNRSNNSDSAFFAGVPVSAVAVDKSVTPDTATPGDEVTFLLTARNVGSTPVDPMQLTDTLPAGLTLLSAEALDQGSCSAAVSCNLGALPAAGAARVRIRALVAAGTGPGPLENVARVSGPNPDPYPADNEARATLNVRTTANLRLSKRLNGAPREGRPVSWTIVVTNDGPGAIAAGAVNDLLPAAVADGSASVPGGSCTTNERLVSCAVPAIPAGASLEIQVNGTLRRDSGAEPLFNGVQIQADAFLPPPFPTAATPPTDVARPSADIGVSNVPTRPLAPRDGVITYNLRARNAGPSPATGVVVRDRLPAGSRLLRSGLGKRCNAKGRHVTCRLGTLPADRAVETALRVKLNARSRARSSENRISIDAAQPDPAGANNRDRAVSPLAPRLVVRKSASRKRAAVGDAVSYRLRVTNRGPGAARDIVLCDRPGAALRIRRAAGGKRRDKAACWTIRRLKRGASSTRRVVATVSRGASASRKNTATVRTQGTRVGSARAAVRVRRPLLGCPDGRGSAAGGPPQAGPAC